MSLLRCEPGGTLPLTYNATDRATNLYPKAFIYDTAGNEITTVNLSHVANGWYIGTYVPDGTYKNLVAHIVPYTDAARTIEAAYESVEDSIYVAYDYKAPGFGSATALATLSDKDKEDIIRRIVEKIDLSPILTELRKKSEFNPKKDLVKTNIKIPPINLRDIKSDLGEIKKLSSIKNKQIDYSLKFIKIDNQFKDMKESIGSEIDVLRGNTERLIRQIGDIQIPLVDLQPILAGIDKILVKKVEDSRQRELLRIDIEKTITDLYSDNRTKQEELQNKLIKELSVIQKAMPEFEGMLEALNKEDFNRINLIIEELKKINQFLKVLSSMLFNKKINDEEELSGIFDLLKQNTKT